MPFSTAQKTQFVALLQKRGWQFSDDTIWSPSRGLWFSDSHFTDSTPAQMHEIFAQRSARIAKAQIGDWELSSRENEEASLAAEEVMRL
jgi:hypothetical protein